MKRFISLLAVTAALALAPAAAHAEPGKTPTKQTAPQEKQGFFDKVGEWFETDKDGTTAAQAKEKAAMAPAAGETQTPRKRTTTTLNAKKRPAAPSADDTNPYVGRVLTEGGADIGIRTNAKIGGGAGGSYGNQ